MEFLLFLTFLLQVVLKVSIFLSLDTGDTPPEFQLKLFFSFFPNRGFSLFL